MANQQKDNCYVCGECMGAFKNKLQVNTSYSEKSILEIIEKILESSLSKEVVSNSGICQNCYIKFNEYDEFMSRAENLQSEILSMIISRCRNDNFVVCKEEASPKESIVEQTIITEDNESLLVEILSENENTEKELTIEEMIEKESEEMLEAKKPKRSHVLYPIETFVTINGEKRRKCLDCGECFLTSFGYVRHCQRYHNPKEFICEKCGDHFGTKQALQVHCKLRHEQTLFYFCDLCDKKFKRKYEIRLHMKVVHTLKQGHFCKVCGKKFTNSKTLEQHQNNHKFIPKFAECKICGYKARFQDKIDKHMVVHTREKKFQCSICSLRFARSYTLKYHIKNVHEKRTCKICNKVFPKFYVFKEHMKNDHQIEVEEVNSR